MKKITEFSVNYPVTITMIILAVLLLGYISFDKLGMDLFPNLNSPKIFIELKVGEKPPEEIEKNYTDQIEAAVQRLTGVTQVSSVSKVGIVQVAVEYNWEQDMDEAFLELQKALSGYSKGGEIESLNISQNDPNSAPVAILAFKNENITNLNDLRKTANNYVRNELIRLEGIADVVLTGEEVNEVVISTDKYRLEAHGLTANEISTKINDFNRNVSGGTIVDMGTRYSIKGVSVYEDLADISSIIVAIKDEIVRDSVVKVPVYLKDIAKIELINKEPESIVKINGKRCIGLLVYKETKFNTIDAVNNLNEGLIIIKKALPGYDFQMVQNQGRFIQDAVSEVEESGLIGICLAVLILYVFLRRIGTTLIVSSAIPISIIATFNLMYLNDLSLNVMTLGGIALGSGMLVDNAIVVMENIFSKIKEGLSVRQAAIEGAAEVSGAIFSSTLTTIVVFLPIVYLHGASGELFKDQAWVVTFSLLSSLVVAILLIPVLSAKFLKVNTKNKIDNKALEFPGYRVFLSSVLEKRGLVILISFLMVVGMFFIIPMIGTEFMPKANAREFTIEMKLATGTDLYRTSNTAESIESIVRGMVSDSNLIIYTQVGKNSGNLSGSNGLGETNVASLKVLLGKGSEVNSDVLIDKLGKVFAEMTDIDIKFFKDETALSQILGTDEAPIAIEIKGEDLAKIEEITKETVAELKGVTELYNLETSFEDGAPEVEVKIDRLRAGLLNVTVSTIATQIQNYLSGVAGGRWEYQGEMKDIIIMLPKVQLKELEDLVIKSGQQSIRLIDIANIRYTFAPKEIIRRNQNRIGKITANYVDKVPFNFVVNKIKAKLDSISFPSQYTYQVTGEELKREKSMSDLTFALILSIILVYMVLASQFESLIHPFTILLTIPLAAAGGVAIFFIIGQPLNIMAYIGLILLGGIAVNNSIILVDAINQLLAKNMQLKEAIITAGSKRIRPILMTSLTTILALIPLTLGFGEGSALRAPMAWAIIGGLTTSTVMSLIVIPCVFYVFENFRQKIKK